MTPAEQRLANNIAALREFELNLEVLIEEEEIMGLLESPNDLEILERAIEDSLTEVEAELSNPDPDSPIIFEISLDRKRILDKIIEILKRYVPSS